jgi:large subunit ribosomal protein L35
VNKHRPGWPMPAHTPQSKEVMPKNKTHSGMKKRVKVTGSGKLLTERAGKRHLLERKPSTLTRRLTGTEQLSAADAPRVKRMLGR